jgi:hypothetical protein
MLCYGVFVAEGFIRKRESIKGVDNWLCTTEKILINVEKAKVPARYRDHPFLPRM